MICFSTEGDDFSESIAAMAAASLSGTDVLVLVGVLVESVGVTDVISADFLGGVATVTIGGVMSEAAAAALIPLVASSKDL